MKYTVEKVACLGCCSLAPVVMIDDKVYGSLDRKKVRRIFKQLQRKEAKSHGDTEVDLLREKLDAAVANEEFEEAARLRDEIRRIAEK